jgi:hydroxymethylbilane synthase
VQEDAARVTAEVLSLDGQRFVRLEETIPLQEGYLKRAEQLGERLMEMGGRELVAEAVRAIGR